jgi:endothelin-converting enzyme/putative endopeptidase
MLSQGLIEQDQRVAKKRKCVSILLILCAVTAVAIAVAALMHAIKRSSSMTEQEQSELVASIRATLNVSVDPCDDFYEFVCGGWISNQTIPDDKTQVQRGFSVIRDRNEAIMKMVAEEDHPIIGPYFKSCLNISKIDEVSAGSALQNLYTPIFSSRNGDVWTIAANLSKIGIDSFLSLGVTVDPKEPQKQILEVMQSLLSMPSPDLYKNDDILAEFLKYASVISQNMPRRSDSDPKDIARAIVDFEKKAAELWTPLSKLQDPLTTYNKFSFAELETKFPLIPWKKFLSGLDPDLKLFENVLVDVPENLLQTSLLISVQSSQFLENYLAFRAFSSVANLLPSNIRDSHFELFDHVLSGAKVKPTREIECIRLLDLHFGDEIAKYFVQKAFSVEAKSKSLEIIKDLKAAFGNNLPSVDWMDDVTRAKAKEKLSQMTDLIGYPDKWSDYSSIGINENDFFGTSLTAKTFAAKNNWARLTKPSDKTVWQMSPPTVNAYYDSTFNTINFPAGILQPVFFKNSYPSYMNFGGIGMVAGHEISQ